MVDSMCKIHFLFKFFFRMIGEKKGAWTLYKNIRHKLLLLPLLDTLLVKLVSVLIAGAALLFLIQLFLDALPLLHQRGHFGLTLLRLQNERKGKYSLQVSLCVVFTHWITRTALLRRQNFLQTYLLLSFNT